MKKFLSLMGAFALGGLVGYVAKEAVQTAKKKEAKTTPDCVDDNCDCLCDCIEPMVQNEDVSVSFENQEKEQLKETSTEEVVETDTVEKSE